MDKFDKYPKTDIFRIVDTIMVPHPYAPILKLISYSSSQYEGNMHEMCIKEFEKNFGPGCNVVGCNRTFEEHVKGLIVEIKSNKPLEDLPELQDYLMSCAPIAKEDGYRGFAFKQEG